jgi:predicted transcriptional regulator
MNKFNHEKLQADLFNKRQKLETALMRQINTVDYAEMIQIPYYVLYRTLNTSNEPNPQSFALICQFLKTQITDYYA